MVLQFFIVFLLVGLTLAKGTELQIVWLNGTNNDPLAVCNDGTPSAYYFAAHTEPAFSNTWLIYLDGGGQCWSQSTCDSRSKSLKSSAGYTAKRTYGGIFDNNSTLSPLWAVNKVFIAYCTSDGWIGDAPASTKTWGMAFRGQRVIRAVLNDLIHNKKILSNGSRVVLAGGSAGGRGMMNNVDFLVPMLPEGSTAVAFLDSPYYVDIPPYDTAFIGFGGETKAIYDLYSVDGIIPESCANAYPNEKWKCTFGEYRMPFVETQYVLVASEFDQFQLGTNIGENPKYISNHYEYSNPKMMDFALSWSNRTIQLLEDLKEKTENSKNLIFSWSCYNHMVSLGIGFYGEGVEDGTKIETQGDAVGLLLNNKLTNTMEWMDHCEGLGCGTSCIH